MAPPSAGGEARGAWMGPTPRPACGRARGSEANKAPFIQLFPIPPSFSVASRSPRKSSRGPVTQGRKGVSGVPEGGVGWGPRGGRGRQGGPLSLCAPAPPPHPLAPQRLPIRTAWLWLVRAAPLANLGRVFMLEVCAQVWEGRCICCVWVWEQAEMSAWGSAIPPPAHTVWGEGPWGGCTCRGAGGGDAQLGQPVAWQPPGP